MADIVIPLKSDWDSVIGWEDVLKSSKKPPVYLKNEAYFRIKDFLTRREKGNLIISGERGAGKTTTVLTLLRDLGDGIFPVYVNALHLESIKNDSKSFLNTIEIIKELISQYSREIERRGFPKEERLENLLMLISATSFIRKEYRESENKLKVNGSIGLSSINAGIDTALGLKATLANTFKDEELFIKAGYSIEDYSRDFSEIIEKLEMKQNYYKVFDWHISFRNDFKINFSFNKIINKVSGKLKTVFIVDELDYYDNPDNPNKPSCLDVLDAIKKLKNLLTLSGAHFIFITGRNAYKQAISPDNDYNTLFSERIFIVKPNGEELNLYLQRVMGEVENSEKIEIFKWSLIEESKHNYFELEQAIKRRQTLESGKPVLKAAYSETEEKLALVHASMNTIYTHFMKIGLFEHYSELLFNELAAIKDNFNAWIHAEGLLPISLALGSQDVSKPIIRNYIKDAKRSFIRYLFKMSETDVPVGLEDLTLEIIEPPWDKLKQKIDLVSVNKGITGAITDDEFKLLSTSKDIIIFINSKLNFLREPRHSSIKSALQALNDKLLFAVDPQTITHIDSTINEISDKLFYERDPKLTKAALESSTTLLQSMESRFVIFRDYLFRIDAGEAVMEQDKLILRNGAKLTFVRKDEQILEDFEFKYKVRLLTDSSVLNFLVHTDISATPSDSFFMFRVDTRISSASGGNGILLKDRNNTNWQYIDGIDIKREYLERGKTVEAKIVFFKKKFSFSVRQENAGSYTDVSSVSNGENVKQVGFLLELGEADLIDLKLIKKRSHNK